MIEFLRKLFGQPGSSATAKERLRLVLMTDHLELAPEMIAAMKRDLVDVISRHVEVDRERIEVSFERQDRALAMLANIPIVSVNRPNGNGAPANGNVTPANGTASHKEATPREPTPKEASSKKTGDKATKTGGTPPTRKRRKRAKKASSASPTLPGTAPAQALAQ